MSAAVAVDGLTVQLPGAILPAPVSLDLTIRDGERVLVLGPSGCGKTTLLRALAGVVPHSIDADVTGTVRTGGMDPTIDPVAAVARVAGSLGQDPSSQVVLTRVADEVAFGLENAAVAAQKIGHAVTDALRTVGAGHLADRDTGTLSGGELQRVALAAVLARRPAVLLLDEPTAMLDPVATAEVQRLALHAGDAAVVMVDHRLEDCAELPARVIVLDDTGRLVADGPTGEVFATRGRELAATGCWLPLAVEVAVAVGTDLACDEDGRLPDPQAVLDSAEPVLRAGIAASGPVVNAPGGTGPVVVAARGVSIAAGRRGPVLVRDLDLELRSGSITAVLGVNGSGKTTTLQGLAGLLPRTSGTLTTTGGVGLVFQFPERQFLTRSVASEIGYGLRGHPAAASRVAAALERYDLAELADVDPFRLSGGQQRRLSVAAMTVLGLPVLGVDEPTFGQDRAHARAVTDELRRCASEGTAVVVTTHDLRMAAAIADHVVVMAAGSVMAQGSAEQILADDGLLSRAALRRPRVLDWWAQRPDLPLRGLLVALDRGPA